MYILFTYEIASTSYMQTIIHIIQYVFTERDGEHSLEVHRHVCLQHAYAFACKHYVLV